MTSRPEPKPYKAIELYVQPTTESGRCKPRTAILVIADWSRVCGIYGIQLIGIRMK